MKVLPILEHKYIINSSDNAYNNRRNISMTASLIEKPIEKESKSLLQLIKNLFKKSKKIVHLPKNLLPKKEPIIAKNRKEALSYFIRNEKIHRECKVELPDGYELYYKMFDPVTHETRITADLYKKNKNNLDLSRTTVFDEKGLKLSEYFVKIRDKKDPIQIRKKDFDLYGKIAHEEIKYKNGDVSNVDYDFWKNSQTTVINSPNGKVETIISNENFVKKIIENIDGTTDYTYSTSSRIERSITDKQGKLIYKYEYDIKE